MSETSIAARINGEFACNVPGSKSMVGNRIVCIGTWDRHIVPELETSVKLKRRRWKYGDMAVGLTHSRGVDGVCIGIPSLWQLLNSKMMTMSAMMRLLKRYMAMIMRTF